MLMLAMTLALTLTANMARADDLDDAAADMNAASRSGDYDTALNLNEALAEQGNVYAQYNLGFMYRHGKSAVRDYKKAMKWFRKAADQGYAHAQSNLGDMYRLGNGVKRDDTEAAKWYRKAADQGDAYAQYKLGGLYDEGEGVRRDAKEAVRWLRKAADQGYILARYKLGLIYRLAAEQGYYVAQNNLGTMYANGEGVLQDNKKAHMWFNIARSNGHDDADHNIKIITKDMTSADISTAQDMAKRCLASNYQDC